MAPEAMAPREFPGFAFRTLPTDALPAADRRLLSELFEACFQQANHTHLSRVLGTLRFVSLALQGETPAGFSIGEVRDMELPRLGRQNVMLGGLTCVAPAYQRRGVMIEMATRIIIASDPPPAERMLFCVRYGHPVAFRSVVASHESGVPRPGVRPTAWQQEVGRVIADAYGVESFDPETFVCKGVGTPVGYPIMDVEVEPVDWEVFRLVDRDRGDSLLGIVWRPDAPEGWIPGRPPTATRMV